MTVSPQENTLGLDGLGLGFMLLATACLLPGLVLPVITTTQWAFWTGTHTIAGLGWRLLEAEYYALAALVWTFSILFPLAKLAWLWRIALSPTDPSGPHTGRMLSWLGKWSMADVFVVAILIVTVRGNPAFQAEPAIGLAFFAASVLFALLASGRIRPRP